MKWIDARKQLPDRDGRYLVILESGARAQHAKRWAGLGQPEICTFCSDWDFMWNARGTLSVAYWMPLPEFRMKWDMTSSGDVGKWVDA